jgi:hypothetical protein
VAGHAQAANEVVEHFRCALFRPAHGHRHFALALRVHLRIEVKDVGQHHAGRVAMRYVGRAAENVADGMAGAEPRA